jgi:exonuclease III
MAETITDWCLQPDDLKLYERSSRWWETLHLSYSHNCTNIPTSNHQWGGTALFCIDKAAHRSTEKGVDSSGLGRWCWTQYKGKKHHSLRIYSVYCPNPPTGPLTVYAHHRHYFNSKNDNRCPRQAFVDDLCKEIKLAMEEGDRVILMLDGDSDMKGSYMSKSLETLNLHEALLQKYGTEGPSTF